MDQTLLLSKCQMPKTRPDLVVRSRLHDLLNESLTKKIIILSAPAGFGKTTLLADWLRRIQLPSSWLSLDDDDNDFAHFIRYLVVALQALDPRVDNTVLELLQSPQPGLYSAARMALLNQIEKIQTHAVLVLDDYHWITNPHIHQMFEYLLSYLPANLHLVIGTREDPPILLSRLRGQGELLEIRMDDLRFTGEEARQFFSMEILGSISDECLSLLTEKTEGWITGLQMTTLSLKGREDIETFAETFSGSNKYILDYLFEEVLRRQSSDVQKFLLSTSVLRQFNGQLCNELMDRSDSQAILERLERANLFLVPLDDERRWYRYHQLFKDLLLHRLSLEYPEKISLLSRKASQWYECAGWISLAIDHALDAGDLERAALLISHEAENTLMRSEVDTYQNWITRIPLEIWDEDPNMLFIEAWARVLKGTDYEKMLGKLAELKNVNTKLAGRIAAVEAFAKISLGEFALAGDYAREAMEKLPQEDHYFRGMATWIFTIYHALQQDMQGSLKVLENLIYSLDLRHNSMVKVMVLSHTARIYFHLGNFQQAERYYRQALDSAKDQQGNWVPIAGEALMSLGDLYRERYQLDQATDLIMDGIELTQQMRKASAIDGYLFLSRVKQLKGDWESANQVLEKAMQLAIENDIIDMDDRIVAMWQARLWSFQGKDKLLESWSSKLDLHRDFGDVMGYEEFNLVKYLIPREKMVLARFYLLKGQFNQALSLIDSLTSFFEDYGRIDFLIEIYLLKALTFQKLSCTDQASMVIGKALKLGEQGGFVGTFLECGPDLRGLLMHYEYHEGTSPYLRQLLEGFMGETSSQEPVHHALVEPISDREMDVLRVLPSNLTTPEIAGEMMISINTVRTHIKNIYQKLGVHKRSEAVRRAKELSIF